MSNQKIGFFTTYRTLRFQLSITQYTIVPQVQIVQQRYELLTGESIRYNFKIVD
jgi:hypothetical protein